MKRIRRRIQPMALLCGSNPVLADQVSRHLTRRGLRVRQAPLVPLDVSTVRLGEAFDLVVADFDIAEPERWQHVVSLRTTFPYVPFMLLSYARPRATELERLDPCVYLRKPPDTDELSAVLEGLRMSVT